MGGTEQDRHNEWPNLEADPQPNAGAGAAPKGSDTKTGDREDLTTQFQELGQRLAATARAAWQSEQRQELQQEVTEGLRSVRDQLNDAVGTIRSSTKAQDVTGTVKEKVSQVADTTRANDLLDDLRGGLATGLRELNEQLRRLTERLERRDETPDTAAGATTTASTAATGATSPAPAALPAEVAPEIDQVLNDPAATAAPTVEPKAELPTKPEGPSGVERL